MPQQKTGPMLRAFLYRKRRWDPPIVLPGRSASTQAVLIGQFKLGVKRSIGLSLIANQAGKVSAGVALRPIQSIPRRETRMRVTTDRESLFFIWGLLIDDKHESLCLLADQQC